MAAVAFDTLKVARRLIAAGMPATQAEAQAEVMAEAFVFNMDTLVTQDYLDARFGEQEARIDARFAEQDARIETRFLEQDGRINALFADQDGRINALFIEQDARFERRFTQIDLQFVEQGGRIDVLTSEMNGKFRLVFWMLTALIGANAAILPMVYKLLS